MLPGVRPNAYADGLNAGDMQFIADVLDALNQFLFLTRVIAVSVTVLARTELLELLLPITQRSSRYTGLLFGLAYRVIYFFSGHLFTNLQFLAGANIVAGQSVPLLELLDRAVEFLGNAA